MPSTTRNKTESPSLTLHFKCWFYVDPLKLSEHTCSLANFLRTQAPMSPRWEVSPLHDWKVDKSSTGKVFIPLEVEFRTTQCCNKHGSKSHQALFDEMWKCLVTAVKHPRFKTSIGLDKTTYLVSYSLWDPERSNSDTMSRWMLPVPADPITMPAERVEQALHSLVSIKLRRQDEAHKNCHGAAVFECIENLLYQQKLKYDELVGFLDELSNADDGDMETIQKCVDNLEAVDKAIVTISTLLWSHVGKAPPPTSRWRLILVLKKLFKRKMATVPIKNEVVEVLKKRIRNDIAMFQRVTPLMMAHIRMRNKKQWKWLKKVLDKTPEGPEKTMMPRKMAIDHKKISDAKTRKSNFDWVRKNYVEEYERVIAGIEAATKECGRAYIAGDDASQFEEKTGFVKRNSWQKRSGMSKHCKCGGEAKEAAVAKAVEDILNEKC